ncbi:hypothetical protein CIK05_08205 [Bdellovibrio sp. qaytius]|nr:hypothetical protein CIK05_08205 [Bdellovibrio sp. qaytius]
MNQKNMHTILLIMTSVFCLLNQSANAESMSCNARQSSFDCMVCNCYHETRGESQEGKIAVAKTVLSRAESKSFPGTVCKVVYQPWQFSWTRDRHSDNINAKSFIDNRSLKDCRAAVDKAIDEGPNGLIFFYNPRAVSPAWAKRVKSCGKVGRHIFLVPHGKKCPKSLGSNPEHSSSQKEEDNAPRSSDGGSR